MKVDVNSKEFQGELSKTWSFVEKVNKNFGFKQHPCDDVNEGVALGLSRQKLMYGKRYCPCFMVEGETKEEKKAAKNRICPCKPALEVELPRDGTCHCGIFCTPKFVEEYAHNKEQVMLESLLVKENLNSEELVELLKARNDNKVEFILIDVREEMEHTKESIIGTDILLPSSTIRNDIEKYMDKQDEHIIVYCQKGSRSTQVQTIMKELGFAKTSNFKIGILGYLGEKKIKRVDKESVELRQERELGLIYAERDNLLRRLRVITSVVSSLSKSEQNLEGCLESITCVVDALGNKEFSV